jgi:hypothetical protein
LTRSQCKAFVLQIDKTKLSQSTKIGIVITLGALLSAAVDSERMGSRRADDAEERQGSDGGHVEAASGRASVMAGASVASG